MPTNLELVNLYLRDYNRFPGDGLADEPSVEPLPVGASESGEYDVTKEGLRQILTPIATAFDGVGVPVIPGESFASYSAFDTYAASNTPAAGTVVEVAIDDAPHLLNFVYTGTGTGLTQSGWEPTVPVWPGHCGAFTSEADNTAALNRWAAFAGEHPLTGTGIYNHAGQIAMGTVTPFNNVDVSCFGMVLNYNGAGDTLSPIYRFGSNSFESIKWSLRGLRFTSDTVMTAGDALQVARVFELNAWDVVLDGQRGTGNFWNARRILNGGRHYWHTNDTRAQNAGNILSGESGLGNAEYYFLSGRTFGCDVGYSCRGGIGGFYLQEDLSLNRVHLRIDRSEVSEQNREFFISSFGILDKTDTTATGDRCVEILDASSPNNFYVSFDNPWIASADDCGIYIAPGVQARVMLNGGKVFNMGQSAGSTEGGDGIRCESSLCRLEINDTLFEDNTGLGINQTVANPFLKISDARFEGNGTDYSEFAYPEELTSDNGKVNFIAKRQQIGDETEYEMQGHGAGEGPQISMLKADGTIDAKVIPADATVVGDLAAGVWDGGAWLKSGFVRAIADGTPVSGIAPIIWRFLTQDVAGNFTNIADFAKEKIELYKPTTVTGNLTVNGDIFQPYYSRPEEFGAVGDGTTDDSAAFNAMFAYMEANGIIDCRLNPRTYALDSSLSCGRVRIHGNGATLLRRHNDNIIRNNLGTIVSGYNVGRMFEMYDCTLDGNGVAFYDAFNHCGIGYCDKVVFKNVTFIDGIRAHAVDLSACENVLFESNRFLGFAHVLSTSSDSLGSDRTYAEAVQLDNNRTTGFSFGPHDGTHCRNVTFTKNYVGPNPANADSRFGSWGVGIGGHSSVHDHWHQNITVTFNTFVECVFAGVRLYKVDGATIQGNRFVGCERGVHSSIVPSDSESAADFAGTPSLTPQACTDISISDNHFYGTLDIEIFFAGLTYHAAATVRDYVATEGVLVSDNYISRDTQGANSSIELEFVRDAVVSGNKLSNVYQGVEFEHCQDLKISQNSFREVQTRAIFGRSPALPWDTGDVFKSANPMVDISVSGNNVDGCDEEAILMNATVEGLGIQIVSNTLIDVCRTTADAKDAIELNFGTPDSRALIARNYVDMNNNGDHCFSADSSWYNVIVPTQDFLRSGDPDPIAVDSLGDTRVGYYREATGFEVADATTGGNLASFDTASNLQFRHEGDRVNFVLSIYNIDTTGLTPGNNLYVRGLPFSAPQRTPVTTFLRSVVAYRPGGIFGDIIDLAEVDTGFIADVSDFVSGQADIQLAGEVRVA